MNASELLPGDVVLDKGHTMIAVGEGLVVDAWGPNANKGVFQWRWGATEGEDRSLKPQSVFRSTESGLGSRAAEYARGWATAKVATLVAPWRNAESKRHLGTMEKAERGGGVVFKHEGKTILDDRRWGVSLTQSESTEAPPFNYDALRRALKYALRVDRGYSMRRGTTCCAFVISCAQAAALRHYAELPLIEKVFKELDQNRAKKTMELPLIDGKTQMKPGYWISPLATAKGANPGFGGTKELGSDKLDEYLAECAILLTGAKEKSWEAIFGSEMYVDAQFTHSSRLLKRLDEAGKHSKWKRILNDEVIKP
jgi:hypothetical protein